MLLPVNDWLIFECFSMRLCCNSQRRALIASSFVVWDLHFRRACRRVFARASMLLCNNYFLISCRSDAVVDTLFVVCHAVYFFNFRYFEANRHSYLRLLMRCYRFFEFFWTAVDFDLRFPAHLRVFIRRHMHNLYKMCSSKICPNAFVSERSFGVFATFVLFCINP